MALTQSEISRRLYQNRKHGGLCPRCGKKLERDGHYCTDCLEKDREYRSKSREFFRENHICSSCGKQIVFGSDKTCPECREKRARIKKNITEDAKEKERERQKSIYKDRKERGVCTRCGKRPPAPGRAKCGICLEKNAEEHRKKNYNRKNIKEYRIENRLCYYCGEPVDTDKKICSKCLQKCKEYGKKSGGGNEYWEKDNKLIFMRFGKYLSMIAKPELERIYDYCGFTDEEEEILKMLRSGKTCAQISARLSCSKRTVDRRISDIKFKVRRTGLWK